MRQIKASDIIQTVADLCQRANRGLGDDVLAALQQAQTTEESPLGREVLGWIIDNNKIAWEQAMPLCQDCGTAVVFLALGQEVHVVGGDLYAAVEEGIHRGYANGHLRPSQVNRPVTARINTGDNTPPVIHTEIVTGERLKITVMPKGGGAENMSRLAMLNPSDGCQGVVDLVVTTVDEAGASPCPPLIIGIGIGATVDRAALLAKKALLRTVARPSNDAEIAQLEQKTLRAVNGLGIGPMGFGGTNTALAVHAEITPTHIASLPVVVNLQCHSARHKEAVM